MPRQVNTPDLWRDVLPVPAPQGNKYDRGHAVIVGAPELTGATRLAADACMRVGAGLVTVATPVRANIYRAALPPEIMVRDASFVGLKKAAAILIGPGGFDPTLLTWFVETFGDRFVVLDAEAVFAAVQQGLTFKNSCVLTPHQGEMENAFPELSGSRQHQAYHAAQSIGAIVVLKGPQTIIANPDGQIVINQHASPYLATAGSGDVLAGMITGLVAQTMPPFEACCAAVWIHAEAALRVGPGLVASDLPRMIPGIFKGLLPETDSGMS